MKVDFVITWLDSSDKEWRKEREKYSNTPIDESRYRDWGTLKYWFRAIEENCGWVNKIFFITYGHIPEWLNTNNEKIVIIKHRDYVDGGALPTFNSCVLELNLHKIKGLSEHFVYFNDDMFVNAKMCYGDFFENGIPKDHKNIEKCFYYGNNSTKINYNCNKIISKYRTIEKSKKYYGVRELVKCILTPTHKPLDGYVSSHMPTSFLKTSFRELWAKESEYLSCVCKDRFRTSNDVSQWLFQYWQIANNNYIERNENDFEYITISSRNIKRIEKEVQGGRHKLICLNDGEDTDNYEENKKRIVDIFNKRYWKKSKFEK